MSKENVAKLGVVVDADMSGLTSQMGAATQAINQFHAANGKAASAFQAGSKSASRFGVVVGQAGYQMQDFAVQISGGQNAMAAFAQQGSQMLGVFGPAGAIAGAALAVGVLVARLFETGPAVKSSAKYAEEAAAVWKKYGDTIKGIREGNMSPTQKKQNISSQIDSLKSANKAPQELLSKLGEMDTLWSTDIVGFMAKYKLNAESVLFPTLEQQLKYEKALADARAKGESAPSFMNDEFGGGGMLAAPNLRTFKDMVKTLQEQASAATGENATKMAELADKLRDMEATEKRLYATQRKANEEAGMSSTERMTDIANQMRALEDKGQTETEEYAKLAGSQEEYARRLRAITTENQRFGESGFTTLSRLRDEMSGLGTDTVEYQEKLKQGKGIWEGYRKKAEGITDTLRPMEKMKREAKDIAQLGKNDLLTPEETRAAIDAMIKPTALPQALQVNAGASALGGTVGEGGAVLEAQRQLAKSAREQTDILRRMLQLWSTGSN